MNGSSIGIEQLRIELAFPKSTLSTALRRLEDRGYMRRYPNMIDARYVDTALTRPGQRVAEAMTDLIGDLEIDVHNARSGQARYGFDRVAWALAAMEDEAETYGPLPGPVD